MLHEIRYSVRGMARAPATTALLLLSLGLGTGANAAVSGVLHGLLLRPPPGIEGASRLVSIYTSEFSGAAHGPSSYADFVSIRAGVPSLAAIAAIDDGAVANVRFGDVGQSARVAAVSPEFFSVLQMQAERGGLFTEVDARLTPAAAVVSFRLARELAAGAELVGKVITVGETQYTVTGVAPERFRGLRVGRECDVWTLMRPPAEGRGDRSLSIVGRLAAGITLHDADADLRRLSAELAARYPETNRGSIVDSTAPRRLSVVPYSQLDPMEGAPTFLIELAVRGASLLLLATACLNVGSLLLARAMARQRDLAIKMALGASRRRLVAQLFAETACLSLGGGALGLLLALWTVQGVPALFMVEEAELLDTRLHAPLVLMTVGVACGVGALFGVAPALNATASTAVTALRADAGGVSANAGGARLRLLLVGAQVALSTMLLLGTGLLAASLSRALEGPQGSAAQQVAFVSMELPGRFDDPVRGVAARNALLARVSDLAGVEAVGWANTLPLGRGNRRRLRIEGTTTGVSDAVDIEANVVSPGYFRTVGLPLIAGRSFDTGDTTLARPVVVVDELLVRRFFGGAAVGRWLIDAKGQRLEIIGVVRSGRYRTFQDPPQPTAYFPTTQDYLWRGHLVVRTTGDPAALLGAIGAAARSAGDGAAVLEVSTIKARLSEELALDRLTATLVGLSGVLALVMSAVGVYGVMTDAVQRRTREIGLRVALGAGRLRVARLVLMAAANMLAIGLSSGAAMSLVLTSVARTLSPGVPPLTLVPLLAVAGALTCVIGVAAAVPLRRALRVSPLIALRAE